MTFSPDGLSASVLSGNDPDDLRAVAGEWTELWSLHPERTPFGLPGWALAWWRVFGAGRSLRCVIVREGERPVALLPFALHEDRSLRLIGTPHADYGDMVGSPEHAPGAFRAALQALTGDDSWDRIVCTNVRDDSVLAAGLRGLPPGWAARLLSEPGLPAPAAVAAGDPSAMYDAFIGKKSLRQFTRKLASTVGELSLVHYEERAEAQHRLDILIQQHEVRSALAGRESQFLSDTRERDLFRALLDELDPSHTVRYSVLWAGPHPVASHFGFEAAGRFLYYKPTFDVDYWELSAGQVLLVKMFEYASTRELPIFDFSIGDEDYKHRFANQTPVTRHYTLSRSRAGGWARGLAVRARQQLHARPRLHQLARRLVRRELPPSAESSGLAGELLAFVAGPSPSGQDGQPARLSELARLAIQHPDTFPLSALDGLRTRLRQGDVCLTVRDANAITVLGWRRADGAPPVLEEWSGRVLYDIWMAAGASASQLAALVASAGHALPVLVLAEPGSVVAGMAATLGWTVARKLPGDALRSVAGSG